MTVMIDMAGNYTPYMTDMTRTFSIGLPDEETLHAHRTSCLIEDEIQRMMRPGLPAGDAYNRALEMAAEAGLGHRFMGTCLQARFVGHGTGLQINEPPVLSARSKDILQEGMTIAVEPKFVIPGVGAAGVEDTFLITATGAERLTNTPRELSDLRT
jgi:Xaa-Pro aminopeptidase